MSAGTGDGVKKTWFGTLVEGTVVTSDFHVHLWNLRREKAIHLIGPENEAEQEQEQAVRMEKVAALEASFVDHKARYKDAIVGAESYEDEVEIPPPLKYYRQKSPSDISRFWD